MIYAYIWHTGLNIGTGLSPANHPPTPSFVRRGLGGGGSLSHVFTHY